MPDSTFEAPAPQAPRNGWWLGALGLLGSLSIVAVAGWIGYSSPARLWAAATGNGAAMPASTASSASSTAASSATPREASRRAAGRDGGGAEATRPAATALTWPLWEFRLRDPLPPRNPPLTPPNWRLIGAAQSQGKWQLIVQRQGRTEPEYFKVGDKMFDRYRVEAITEDDVTLVDRGRRLVLSYIGY